MLQGKNIVVTGVLTPSSIAYHIAEKILEEGGNILLTAPAKSLKITQRTASRLDSDIDVIEFDALGANLDFTKKVEYHFPKVHGLVHAIAGAPNNSLGGGFLETSSESANLAFETSSFSLKKLVKELLPLLSSDSSIVGLTFDSTKVYPGYDWMGVSKSALEGVAKYLALYLGSVGVRVNLISAGPVNTFSTQNMVFFNEFMDSWNIKSPLGWSDANKEDIAKACAVLLSDWLTSTTGEIIHVDGGRFINGS
jgi:enoyl-[acyl-carrier protein] reductase I